MDVTNKFNFFPQESATCHRNLPFVPPACRMLEPHKIAGLVHRQWQICLATWWCSPPQSQQWAFTKEQSRVEEPPATLIRSTRNTGWEMVFTSELLRRCYPYFYVRFARGHIDAEFTSLPQAKSRQLMVCMYAQDDKSSGKLSVVSGFGFTTVLRILLNHVVLG